MKGKNSLGIRAMEGKKKKYNLPVVTAEVFDLNPERFELRKGNLPDAPPCPFGHQFKWIGYDKQDLEYVRVTKSVFKRLIKGIDQKVLEDHESYFNKLEDR